jgi:hypothetical protein
VLECVYNIVHGVSIIFGEISIVQFLIYGGILFSAILRNHRADEMFELRYRVTSIPGSIGNAT